MDGCSADLGPPQRSHVPAAATPAAGAAAAFDQVCLLSGLSSSSQRKSGCVRSVLQEGLAKNDKVLIWALFHYYAVLEADCNVI